MERDDESLEQCRAVVAMLGARHQWRLLSDEEFIERAIALVATQQHPNPQRAAVGVYSAALYVACTGAEGPERREQAYTELWRYLCTYARWRYADVGQDAVQSALEQICASIDRCRKPMAFLAFALQALMNAARAARHQGRHEQTSLDAWCAAGGAPPAVNAELDGHVIAGECQRAIGRLIDEFLWRYPRARQQFAALWLKYIEGLDDLAISARLGVSVSAVYVLRTRARKRLRADPLWRGLAEQVGLALE